MGQSINQSINQSISQGRHILKDLKIITKCWNVSTWEFRARRSP